MSQENQHLLAKADALYRRGRYDEALAEIARVQAGQPPNADALFLEALCLHGAGRINEALDRCKQLGREFHDHRVQTLQARIGVQLPPEAYMAPRRKRLNWKRPLKWAAVLGMVVAIVALVPYALDRFAEGAGRLWTVPLRPGLLPPMSDSPPSKLSDNQFTAAGQTWLEQWASNPLPDWQHAAKVTAPRVCLAKLALGRDVPEVNVYLQSQVPSRNSGSSWRLGPLQHAGDYDFAEVTLTTLLYVFGGDPDRLYPETVDHIVNVLLIEEGGKARVKVPGSYGMVIETENHHLMTEGSRYLKNQWLFSHGNTDSKYNNQANGLETWLKGYLQQMIDEGVYEFNSQPYIGYTIQALLNLEAFPDSSEITSRARYVLDIINYQYALGSLDLRRLAPFRRQTRHAEDTALNHDYNTEVMSVWTSRPAGGSPDASMHANDGTQGIIAELCPYRPPDDVLTWTIDKRADYFVQFGRGPYASPELYSGGPGYLLSAGGVHRGKRSMIAARPISLILNDGATDLMQCFHIRGKGNWEDWNNTGVYRHFACGTEPVAVPEQYAPAAQAQGWAVFRPEAAPELSIAVFSADDFGLIALFPGETLLPQSLLEELQTVNPDAQTLKHTFHWLDGRSLSYVPNAPKGTWVIESVDGVSVDRDYDSWPHVDGDPPLISFHRRL
ncbi:MAG TPA: tetratricopeptide repeat protein [Candidatus Hydrogenedentes bacterium]|nr:tetratricopeptide repeat protein [Candidatus Hydrogenedentota bacterium]